MKYWGSQWNPRNWSIAAKLIAALLSAVLLPIVVLGWLNFQLTAGDQNSVVQSKAYRAVQTMAYNIADVLDQLMGDTEHATMQLAGEHDVQVFFQSGREQRPDLRAAIEQSLDAVLQSNPDYEYILLVSRDGTIVAARQRAGQPNLEGKSFPNLGYMEAIMAGRQYTDVRVSPVTHKLSVYFAAPVSDKDRQTLGAAIIQMQGEAIHRIINQHDIRPPSYAFLINQDGVIVDHADPTWQYRSLRPLDPVTEAQNGRRFAIDGCTDPNALTGCRVQGLGIPSLSDALLGASTPGYIVYNSPADGRAQLVAYAPAQRLHWIAAISIPQDILMQPVTDLIFRSILLNLAIGLLAAVAAVLLARSIARPIRRLAIAAGEIEQDRPFQPDSLAGVIDLRDEIGHLARAFTSMVLALHTRLAELRTIFEIGSQISSSIELDETLRYILESIRAIIPFDLARILLYDPEHNHIHLEAWAGHHSVEVVRDFEVRGGYIQYLFQTRASLLVPEIRSFREAQPDVDVGWGRVQPRSYLGVPLSVGEQMIGAIEMLSTRPNSFTQDNLRMLENISLQASVAVQNAQQVQIREARLKQQIQELRIEIDEVKRARTVQEIVDTDTFQRLREKAQEIRARNQRTASAQKQHIP